MRLPNHVLCALIPPQSTASQIYNPIYIADTHYNCHHTPHACQTLTSLHECSIKTNIRHVTLELLLCIICLLCILGLHSVMPLINEDWLIVVHFVQIHLFCGDQLLGSCDVPIDVLTRKFSDSSYSQPVSISDYYAVSGILGGFVLWQK